MLKKTRLSIYPLVLFWGISALLSLVSSSVRNDCRT